MQSEYSLPLMEKLTDDFYINRQAELGHGQYGKVFQGFSLSQKKPIAVKFMSRKNLMKAGEKYKRELQVMASLSKVRHPYIMGYYGHIQRPDGVYLFVQFCAGGDLKRRNAQHFSEVKVIQLFRQLLEAMVFLNRHNIVHRDLKPENVLLDENGHIKLADFGLARELNDIMSIVGTPLYQPPEIFKNITYYSANVDVWAAGLILYEMLTGKEYFGHVKNKKQLQNEIDKLKDPQWSISYPESLHPAWQQLTRTMLTHDREKRPTFQQFSPQFLAATQVMLQDLLARYQYEHLDDLYDPALKITTSIRENNATNKEDSKEMNKGQIISPVNQIYSGPIKIDSGSTQLSTGQAQTHKDAPQVYKQETQAKKQAVEVHQEKTQQKQDVGEQTGAISISARLQEQLSYCLFNRLRKYLLFMRLKNEMRTCLLREFTSNTYPYVRNVYKFMLMFLSAASYLAHQQRSLNQINSQLFAIPDGAISIQHIHPAHYDALALLLSEYKHKQEYSLNKFKEVLQEQVISPLLDKYYQRKQDKIILEQHSNILSLIKQAKEGSLSSNPSDYEQKMLELANSSVFKRSHGQLEQWETKNVYTYALIRVVVHLDKVMVSANYLDEDYLLMVKQKLKNMHKEQLITFIAAYN